MKKVTWLVFDCNNLAWRAFHTTGQLSHKEQPTGVLYGVLREIRHCMAKWETSDCVFCFDHPTNFRVDHNPWYKASRKHRKFTDEEVEARRGCHDQMDLLRTSVVERVGLGNVLYKRGFEADDLIASVCGHLRNHQRAVVVSGDHDLYQCLSPKVVQYHPAQGKVVTQEDFIGEFGIPPEKWALVKAISGCKSDDIPGIGGNVGEKTACLYLAGKHDCFPKPKLLHIDASLEFIQKNLTVTRLPYPGTPVPDLDEGLEPIPGEWDVLMSEFGFGSMNSEVYAKVRKGSPVNRVDKIGSRPKRK